MPIRDIQFERGCYYHLYNRGVNRQTIFVDDRDFLNFLTRIKRYCEKYAVQVVAYCLLYNHFHFLLGQDGAARAGLVIQDSCNGYAQYFNKRHARQGALFQGRFRGELVQEDAYLHHLCRYIHGNPVKDGFALKPELWPYSNYLEWTGQRAGKQFDPDFIVDHFGSPERYVAYLHDYLVNAPAIPEKLRRYLAQFEG
ncbi:MAG: transposase [Caldilineaceae bacterium]